MAKPGGSSTGRSPIVEDDEDLDDLDDVLASFNAPKTAAPPAPAAQAPAPSPPAPPSSTPAGYDDDFEASLVEGMESLLRQLAGDHSPGPMADTSNAAAVGDISKGKEGEKPSPSAEDEEAAWQRAVEMMLSGEGLSAMGLDAKAQPDPAKGKTTSPGEQPSFDETIRRTMESLKNAGESSRGNGDKSPDLSALLKQLSSDPSMLDGLDDGEDDELGGLLDGMMGQLMTREVLEEPMAELASKYPAYLASPPSSTPPADLEKYRQQYAIVEQILETFKKPGYTDEKDGKEIARLVGEMQDLGGPPNEIMGELPEGFDLGALGGEEGCTIM